MLSKLPTDILEHKIFYYLKYWDLVRLSLLNKYFNRRLAQVKLLQNIESWPSVDLQNCSKAEINALSFFKWKFNRIHIDSEAWIQYTIPSCFRLKVTVDYGTELRELSTALLSNTATELYFPENGNMCLTVFHFLFQNLSKLTKLKKLQFENVLFSLEMMNVLWSETELVGSHITRLLLTGCQIDDDMMQILCPILPRTKIKYLDLNSNDIENIGLAHLGKYLQKSKIEHLKLVDNYYSREGLAALAKGLLRSKVRELEIYSKWMCFDEFPELFQVLHLTQLERLYYPAALDSDTQQVMIECIPRSLLRYSSFQVDGRNLAKYVDAVSKSKITDLEIISEGLRGNNLLQPVAKSLKKAKLKRLKLSFTTVFALEQLLSNINPSVEVLDLSFCHLGDNAMSIISKALPSSVKKLDLTCSSFTEAGLNHLKKIKVRHLVLGHFSVSNQALAGFIMAQGRRMVTLDLSLCNMDTGSILRVAGKYPINVNISRCNCAVNK